MGPGADVKSKGRQEKHCSLPLRSLAGVAVDQRDAERTSETVALEGL